VAFNLNNLAVLTVKPKTIRVGVVQAAMKNSRWQIAAGNMMVSATASMELLPKQRVIIGQTNEGWAVLDSSRFSLPAVTSVKIDG
jgi:hypothetical protein